MDTSEAVKHVLAHQIEGDFVECGVGCGRHPKVMCDLLNQANRQDITIWMYDTFGGLTHPSEHDFTRVDATLYQMSNSQVVSYWQQQKVDDTVNKWCYDPLDQVKAYVEASKYPTDKLRYIVGDVCKTLQEPANLPEKIALLRLDTDWYESSKVELEVLYDRVPSGGVIILDDYFHWDGQRKATDDFLAARNIQVKVDKYSANVGSFIKP